MTPSQNPLIVKIYPAQIGMAFGEGGFHISSGRPPTVVVLGLGGLSLRWAHLQKWKMGVSCTLRPLAYIYVTDPDRMDRPERS